MTSDKMQKPKQNKLFLPGLLLVMGFIIATETLTKSLGEGTNTLPVGQFCLN